MTAREFFELVASMREHQKAYFKTRDGIIFRKCIELEKKVDAEIKRVSGIVGKPESKEYQGNLFD